MTASESAIVSKLPTYAVNAFVQLRGEGDAQWKLSARLLERVIEDAARKNKSVPKMKLYADAAAYLGQGLSTVRNWVGIRDAVGDDLLDEYDGIFTFSHWRLMVPAAKRATKPIADFAAELAATADDYAGMPIPVDVIAARAAGAKKTPTELVQEALENVEKDFVVIARHIAEVAPGSRATALNASSAVTNLAVRVGKEIQERTKMSGSESEAHNGR